MIAHRLRGLVNLHIAATALVSGAILLAYASIYRYLPFAELSSGVNLVGYLVCVELGMIVGSRHLHQMASRYHRFGWMDSIQLTVRQMIVVSLVVFAMTFAFKDRDISRVFIGSFLVINWCALLFFNHSLPKVLARIFFETSHRIPTLFVGSEGSLAKLKNWLASKEALGLKPVGFVTFSGHSIAHSFPTFVGGVADLPTLIEERAIMQVVVLEIPRSAGEGRFIIETCQAKGSRLLIYSNLSDHLQFPLVTVNEAGHQFYTLQDEPLEDPLNRLMKRLLDILIALPVVLFVLPPLALLVWAMQKIQAPGRVFFSQERTGHSHRVFLLHKFRSMYDIRQDSAGEAKQASKGDKRIYPFGEFLRKSSLDEFPQFINVLFGTMSVVGPRPHLIAHDKLFAKEMNSYRTRFFVKPGITGLAQCNGFRGEITDPTLLHKRIEYDLAYITQWSLWLDLEIIMRTAHQILFPPKSAY
ncbi:exopolysaccharide biosynthesis polyprenyl glycosylphosphotransferase [Oleiharenicola lentus]|uniref:exopolysaccharide biosynthesis polyprenyl glycosylphosphotransferase n=1 Tax=Oleiharenicola lentus TaxID=2508720 RepID=UPI003F680631